MKWTTEKPTDPCVFVSAKLMKIRNGRQWEHNTWEIKEVNWGEGPYLALLTGDGDEWGDLADLTADQYLILPKH